MAEDKRVVRTPGIAGTLIVGDLTVTPDGLEVTKDEWVTIRDAGFANGVHVFLDEDFPVETSTTPEADIVEESPVKSTDAGTTVDGTDTSPTVPVSGGRGTSKRG